MAWKLCSWQWHLILTVTLAVIIYRAYQNVISHKNLPVDGFVNPEFKRVEELFKKQMAAGASSGCAVAVYYRGTLVVDLWGGYADYEFKIPWRKNTLVNIASVTKGLAALALALLAQRGELDYGKLVTEYWPEFGQNSKGNITVDMLLSHQAGILTIRPRIDVNTMKDWIGNSAQLDALLAKQKPAWPPGTAFGYTALAYGLYLDALVRHVDSQGRTASQYFRDEIAIPHDIDCYIGLPPELFYRKARSEPQQEKYSWVFDVWKSSRYLNLSLVSVTSPRFRQTFDIFTQNLRDLSHNDPEYANIPWPTGHGFATASAMAKLFSFLATSNDDELFTQETINSLSETVVSGVDSILNLDIKYGRGLYIMENVLGEDVLASLGFGGQQVIADWKRGVSMAYLTNENTVYGMGYDPKVTALEKIVYECIEDIEKSSK